MTEHDIEINELADARHDIGEAIRRLQDAAAFLAEYEHRDRLVVIMHRLREIDRELYEKIHPPQTT